MAGDMLYTTQPDSGPNICTDKRCLRTQKNIPSIQSMGSSFHQFIWQTNHMAKEKTPNTIAVRCP